jgi:hypothetical protein
MSAKSMCWVMYPSKNVVLCLRTGNVVKTSPNSVYYLLRPPDFCPHKPVSPAPTPPPPPLIFAWHTEKQAKIGAVNWIVQLVCKRSIGKAFLEAEVRFTYWTSKDWTSNDWTSNDSTSNNWTSNDWTSNDWTSNDWTSNDKVSKKTKCQKRPNLEWLSVEWTERRKLHEFLQINFIYSKHCLELPLTQLGDDWTSRKWPQLSTTQLQKFNNDIIIWIFRPSVFRRSNSMFSPIRRWVLFDVEYFRCIDICCWVPIRSCVPFDVQSFDVGSYDVGSFDIQSFDVP